jgi:hypothetical protein
VDSLSSISGSTLHLVLNSASAANDSDVFLSRLACNYITIYTKPKAQESQEEASICS